MAAFGRPSGPVPPDSSPGGHRAFGGDRSGPAAPVPAPGGGSPLSSGALWALFLYYLAILSVLLFFGGLFQLDRVWGGSVNLEPFHTIRNYVRFYRNTGSPVSIMNLLGNAVIMVPLGVLLPLLFRSMCHFWTCLPLCALTAVGVEWLQWVTATGAADVDDSILNFLGAALGYFLVRLCQLAAGWRQNS